MPGPGQPGADDPNAYLFATDTPGELCIGVATYVVDYPTSIAVYQGAAGTNGALVVDFSGFLQGEGQCVEGVSQATIDGIVADASGYYLQIDSQSYPDGATRGQLVYVPPTIGVYVSSVLCPAGMHFPPKPKDIARQCGAMVVPGDGFPAPLGFTSTNWAGEFPFDYRVAGPAGFNESIAGKGRVGGGSCDPQTLICSFGGQPYGWTPQPGPLTIDPTLIPSGFTLSYDSLEVTNETGVVWSRGPNGHLAVDMTGRYQGTVHVAYYYTAAPGLASPIEAGPTVALGSGAVDGDGKIPLSLSYGALEIGNAPVHYEVQVQADGHAYQAVTTTTNPIAAIGEQAGYTYRFRVRATNQFGATSAWAIGSTVQLDTLQNTSADILYGGAWQAASSSRAYGGTTTFTGDYGATADVTFTASQFAVVMPRQAGGGDAFVVVDNQVTGLNTSSRSLQARQLIFVSRLANPATHQLELQVAGDGRVDLDAIVLLH